LEPQAQFKYTQSISIPRGEILHSLQVVDNLIVVHNLDDKSSNYYDVKLAEYAQPICVDNIDVDTQYASENYHSDILFNEEKLEDEGGDGQKEGEQAKQSKEYFEVNFQFNYGGDE